jgi:hypothetical protein
MQQRRGRAEIDPGLDPRAFERLQWPLRIGPDRPSIFGKSRPQRVFDHLAQRTAAFMRDLLRLLQERVLDRNRRPHASRHLIEPS